MTLSFKEDEQSMRFVFDQLICNRNMTQWEQDFVVSVADQFEAGQDLFPKQLEKLSDLWEKY